MKINLTINDELIAKAQSISHINDKKILIEAALKLFVTVQNQNKLMELWGKIEADDKANE
jgi:predicted neuraminidase